MQYKWIHYMTAFKSPNVRYMYIRDTYSRIRNEKITKQKTISMNKKTINEGNMYITANKYK